MALLAIGSPSDPKHLYLRWPLQTPNSFLIEAERLFNCRSGQIPPLYLTDTVFQLDLIDSGKHTFKMAYTAAHQDKANPGPYTHAFLNQNGPGDARPTGLQIVEDNDLVGKLTDKVYPTLL